MFELLPRIKDRVLAIKFCGEITASEHDQIDRLIRQRIAEQGRIRILLTVKHYPSFGSAEALFEDLRMIKLHSERIERLAVVGDRPWKGTWVALFGLFGGLETDYFEMDQIQAAWQWITEGLAADDR